MSLSPLRVLLTSAECSRKVVRCSSFVVFAQSLIASLCPGADEETWIVQLYYPRPLLLMSALSGQRARATGPPSSILPTRHHCLFRTSGFLPEPNRRVSRPRGRPYVTHFPTGVDDRSVHDGVLDGVLVILTSQRRFPSALAVCAPVLFLVCLPRPTCVQVRTQTH